MALTQSERIAISKKLINIPREDALVDITKAELENTKLKAIDNDNGNKNIQDVKTALIDAYQKEIARYDGNVRTEVTETDMDNAANRTSQNFFFPNDSGTVPPSISGGYWKALIPFSGGLGIGKNYLEAFPSTISTEVSTMTPISSTISSIEALSAPIRSTSYECDTVPSDPTFSVNSTMTSHMSTIKSQVTTWESHLDATRALIVATEAIETDATRSAQNVAAIADIDAAKSVIDTWQALPDFDTTTYGAPPTGVADCATWDALTSAAFVASKARSTELDLLKAEITARTSFVSTRDSEIDAVLGGVTQNMTTGLVSSYTGLYGERFRFIDLRLNVVAGSLSKIKGLEKAIESQDAAKVFNASTATAYDLVIKVSKFTSPAAGTKIIHVKDASQFSVSDSVYIIADTQAEIAATIDSIDNNRITLDTIIPRKYRENDGARIYKTL